MQRPSHRDCQIRKNMRRLYYSLLLILTAGIFPSSCDKDNPSSAHSLLEHKWQIVSLNGEVYRYVGHANDYFDFRDDTLIIFYDSHYDTLYYQLTNGGKTLDFYPILNGSRSATGYAQTIQTLTASQLILFSNSTNPPIQVLDSLRR